MKSIFDPKFHLATALVFLIKTHPCDNPILREKYKSFERDYPCKRLDNIERIYAADVRVDIAGCAEIL